jgi:L-lysine exporter family protein LysE/ArgO
VIGSSSLRYNGSRLITYTLACIAVSWCWFSVLVLLGRNVGRIPQVARTSSKLSALAMWGCAAFLLFAWLK